jgi:hypothetical protein
MSSKIMLFKAILSKTRTFYKANNKSTLKILQVLFKNKLCSIWDYVTHALKYSFGLKFELV